MLEGYACVSTRSPPKQVNRFRLKLVGERCLCQRWLDSYKLRERTWSYWDFTSKIVGPIRFFRLWSFGV